MPTLSSVAVAERERPSSNSDHGAVLYAGCLLAERADMERRLASRRIAVTCVDAAAQVVETFRRRPQPVVLDLTAGPALLESVRSLRALSPSATVFALVAPTRPEIAVDAIVAGVTDVLLRPLDAERLASMIGDDPVRPDAQLYALSAMMRDAVAAVSHVAATPWTGVVVRGEPGSGRGVIARAVHRTDSQTSSQHFVVVDCAAGNGSDLELELFGTDAEDAARGLNVISRSSLLFAANGGTLYLEHVTDTPGNVQMRLARLLRDRHVVIAETGQSVLFAVRPMAAIDAGFEAAVEEGTVRGDLYRRLAAMHVDAPPLRRRREDIPLLANHFVQRACRKRKIARKLLTRPTLALLSALPWRGNAGELRGLMETIVDGGRSSVIALEDVLTYVRLDGGTMVFSDAGTLRQARAKFESEYIAAMLRQHRGRVTEAAKALGIQRPNLYRKMRALKVTRRG